MKSTLFAVMVAGMASSVASAATVAIVDSGFDHEHEALKGKVWVNPTEIAGDQLDNDGNGKIDDINGWNFADNNGEIFDYAAQIQEHPDSEKFLELQLAVLTGKATEGERIWLKEREDDRAFMKSFIAFSNYAHGTHVAGIIARDNPQVKLQAIKTTSTKTRVRRLQARAQLAWSEGKGIDFIREFIVKLGLSAIAHHQAQSLAQVSEYLAATGVSVANGWASIDMAQARGLVTPLLMVAAESQPSAELVEEYAAFFVQRVVAEEQKILAKYPGILFVFAAGNEASDNDSLPSAPESIRLDNVLTVGATVGNVAFAPFSNYGASHVDVFAPGVGIRSSVPRQDRYLAYSGTSLAAPEVARVAALIKDKNPALQAKDVREILLGTTDRKGFLKGRAYTEGVINAERAQLAAAQSLTTSVRAAIAAAKRAVADQAPSQESVDGAGGVAAISLF